jgi:hypothetical protein
VTDDGVEITTHSMLKAFGRCPNQARYKYSERLKKRLATERDKPLKRGTWMHSLLEEHYAGRDWKVKHRELSAKFAELFDEEKDALGDLPTECAQLMRAYLWHYGANKADPMHGWEIFDTEVTLECPWPDGRGIYRCRVDFLARDEFGMIIGDHKNMKSTPGTTQRLLDHASALYIWCARENNIPVRAFLWNYLRTKAPTVPQLAYAGTGKERLSNAAIDTEYVTYYLGIKALDRLDDPVAIEKLKYLKGVRWKQGEIQSSTFFRRETLEKDDAMIARVVAAAMKTRDRMHDYDYTATDEIERVTERSCDWCDFRDLCSTELYGGNAQFLRRKMFRTGDPLDYYNEIKETASD